MIVRRHHVEDGHALELLEVGEAEHLEVGRIGVDVHALVHVGDRVARALEQGRTALLALAPGLLAAGVGAPLAHVLELARHYQAEVLGVVAAHIVGGARLEGLHDACLVVVIGHRDDRDAMARGVHRPADLGERRFAEVRGAQYEVGRAMLEGLGHPVEVGRVGGPHGVAGVAQDAVEGLGLVQRLLHHQHADDLVILHGFAFA